jgi:hypothetical protein
MDSIKYIGENERVIGQKNFFKLKNLDEKENRNLLLGSNEIKNRRKNLKMLLKIPV